MSQIDTSPEAVALMLEGVTPGPWHAAGPPWNQIIYSSSENRIAFTAHSNGIDDDRDIATARFIAWSREAVPALAARVAELEAERDRFEAALARACLVGGTTYLVDRAQSAEARAEAAEAQVAKLESVLAEAQYGLSWASAYFRDSCPPYCDEPCPPVTRGLNSIRALSAVKREVREVSAYNADVTVAAVDAIRAERGVDVSDPRWKTMEAAEAQVAAAREAALKEASLAVANVEIGFHDGISGDWHPLAGPSIISAACAAIRALSTVKQEGGE